MSDDAVRVQQLEADLRELRQTLGATNAELHRAIIQPDERVREAAYRLVQRHAMRAWEEGADFRALLAADPELTARVSHGMTPMAAIRIATMDSAEALGTPDRGQVKVGLMADLIAVSGETAASMALAIIGMSNV